MSDRKLALVTPESLDDKRRQVEELLGDAYSRGVLDDDEFERRIDLCERAEAIDQFEPLLDGVVSKQTALAVRSGQVGLVPESEIEEKKTVLAIFSATSRSRSWNVPRHLRVVATMGGVELDFREARMVPGVTEVHVTALFGGAQITVPPGLPVEVDGTGILGAFDDKEITQRPVGDSPCSLRITGLAVLGGVDIRERLPGESKKEAKKRRKREARGIE